MRIQLKYVGILATVLISVEGCVSTRTASVEGDSGSAMRGKSLAVTRRPKPDFSAMTAGKMMFGVVGAIATISAGNQIVADNAVEDPAADIGLQLSRALEGKYGLVPAAGDSAVVDTTDTQKLASMYSGSDFVLDVQTVNWSFVYRPSLTHYRVLYSVKIRLIDTRRSKLVGEAFCYRRDDGDKSPPTRDELLADHAELLKQRLHDHASECAGELQNKLLGIPIT